MGQTLTAYSVRDSNPSMVISLSEHRLIYVIIHSNVYKRDNHHLWKQMYTTIGSCDSLVRITSTRYNTLSLDTGNRYADQTIRQLVSIRSSTSGSVNIDIHTNYVNAVNQ